MAHGTHSGRQVGQGVGGLHGTVAPSSTARSIPADHARRFRYGRPVIAAGPRLTEPAPQLDPVPALLPHGAHSLDDDFNVRASLLAAHWLGNTVLE